MGIVYSIVGGILVSLQSIFNTRVSERIGLWETTTVVHGIGFVFSLLMLLFWREGNMGKIAEVKKLYLVGGAFGVLIVYCVMRGIGLSGPTLAIGTLLVAQLIATVCIDTFGLFGAEKIAFHFSKPLGIVLMIAGVVIFKVKG
ncbi:transporter family-2 protein [Anaerosolibacter carboniphilus]|uniref:Transporter family-2 protein n=1 Tax=Anaerosolibacter carboniphilus TaxID=1417629 RepID=A0A841KXF5_9FIRM|nr:transporter family-2 protein [Anaerosolibacter carboniphilus]